MRFIQMWFLPSQHNLKPSVEQRQVEKKDRTNKFLLLVSNQPRSGEVSPKADKNPDALKIFSDAEVYSCFLQKDKTVKYPPQAGRGAYIYVLDGGPVSLNDNSMPPLAAAKIIDEKQLILTATSDAELLLITTAL